MDRSRYLIKNVGLLTISNFSSKILIFLLVPLYTSVLTTAEYGTYDFIISTVGLIYPIFTLNIVDGVMRFIMDNSKDKKSVISIGFINICVSIMFVIFLTYILNSLRVWKGLLVYFFIYYAVYSFNQFFIQMAKGLEKVTQMSIAGVISTITMILGNIWFLLVINRGLSGFFIANIMSQGLSAAYLCIRMKSWEYIDFKSMDKNLKCEMLKYSIPLIATTLGWWVNNTLDKYAVVFICGVAANGLLSVSYKIPSVLNVAQQIFIQAWQISAIKEYGEEGTKYFYGKIFSLVNMMMCILCSILILMTKPLSYILFAKDFYIAWKYVPFLLLSTVFNCAAGVLGSVLSAKKDTRTMMWAALIGAGINAIFNIGFIYAIGIQGATIATAISSIVIFVIRLYGTGEDIVIQDKYYISWLLLILQAMIEVVNGNILLELVIFILIIIVNKKKIYLAFKRVENIRNVNGKKNKW